MLGGQSMPNITPFTKACHLDATPNQCYRNRIGHRTGEAQNVNRTGTSKKLGKKSADQKIHKIFIFCKKIYIYIHVHTYESKPLIQKYAKFLIYIANMGANIQNST